MNQALTETMQAFLIRPERYGEPQQAIQLEQVQIPTLGPHQVLIEVMAAGLNYNNVWAAQGKPVDIIAARRKRNRDAEPFHIGGSEASGYVKAVGDAVTHVKVGDTVVVSCSVYDATAIESRVAPDPMFCSNQEIYGYETSYGSFAEYTLVEDYQCFPKPKFLSWEESATLMLNGPTAYKQLTHWAPNTVKPGDAVLIWGAAGGLGSMSIQLTRALGGAAGGRGVQSRQGPLRLRTRRRGVLAQNRLSAPGTSAGLELRRSQRLDQKLREFPSRLLHDAGEKGAAQSGDRALRPSHLPHLAADLRPLRHGGHRGWHVRLQLRLRCPPPVDAPEAHPGLPLRQHPRVPGIPATSRTTPGSADPEHPLSLRGDT